MEFEIVSLVVSPVHRYEGRPSDGVLPYDGPESPDAVQVRAHQGIVGDRYFGTKHRHAAVTFLAAESIDQLEGDLGPRPDGAAPFRPELARRNVVTRGLDVESLVHTTFTIGTADGTIAFRSLSRANPCAWMNLVFAEGAHQALRGHGGIRAEPLDDAVLRIGPATLLDVVPVPADELSRSQRAVLGVSP